MSSSFSPSARPDGRAALAAPASGEEDHAATAWLVTFSDLVLQLFAFVILAAAAVGGKRYLDAPAAEARVADAGAMPAASRRALPAFLRRTREERDGGPVRATGRAAAQAANLEDPPTAVLAQPTAGEAAPLIPPEPLPSPPAVASDSRPGSSLPAAASQGGSGSSPPIAPRAAEELRLAALAGYLEDLLRASGEARGAMVTAGRSEILISLPELAGFSSGKADLPLRLQAVLGELRDLIAYLPGLTVDVSGHTDDRPIRSALYPSNLDLSLARAARVAHAIAGDDPRLADRTFASGFGERRPVASNVDAEGRARNRRVEIRIAAAR